MYIALNPMYLLSSESVYVDSSESNVLTGLWVQCMHIALNPMYLLSSESVYVHSSESNVLTQL